MIRTNDTTITTKDQRLYLRMSSKQKNVINRAAQSRHLTISQFVMQATMDAAEAVLNEQNVFTMTPEQWEKFQARLDEPARIIPALQQLHAEMTNG